MENFYNHINKILVLILIQSLAFFSCGKKDDEAAINTLIRNGAERAERHEIGKIMELASDDFIARPGNLNKSGTKGILWRTFNYYKEFKILYPKPDIAIEEDGQYASAGLPFLIVKQEHAFTKLKELFEDPIQWIEEAGKSADIYRLEMDLVKKNGEWLVKAARVTKYS